MLSFFKVLIGGIVRIIPTIFGDRARRESYQYHAQAAAMHQYAAEFRRHNRTWLDVVVDSLNRLIRPTIVVHVLWSFWYLVLWPDNFGILMAKLALAPEWYTYIVVGVLLFWFGGRPFEKSFNTKFDKEKFDKGMEVVREMKEEQSYQEELDDTSKPMSNRAILEWNRRRQEK